MNVVQVIQHRIRGEVVTNQKVLKQYATDASLFEVMPSLAVYPRDERDVRELVTVVGHAREQGNPKVSLTARSAGTDMTGGPLTESIVVEFTRHFHQLIEVGQDFAVVEPGVYYRDLEAVLHERDLLLPSYPASKGLATVGGMVANNAGGEKTLTYGKTADYVQELRVVLGDGKSYAIRPITLVELEHKKQQLDFEGEFYRRIHELIEQNWDLIQSHKPTVSKNSAGYALWDVLDREKGVFDLTRLFSGSQGTLGLITRIRFRLVRPKPYSSLLVLFLPDMQNLGEIVNRVLAHKPESFESYDDQTLKVTLRLFPALIRRLKGNIISLALRFIPEFFMLLRGGIPKLVLLAEFTGNTEQEARQAARQAQQSLSALGLRTKVTRSAADAEKYWTMRRESFSLLRQSVQGMHTAPFIDDFVVAPEKLPAFLPRLYEILNQYDILYTVAGHIGNGNFHIIPLMDLEDTDTKRILTELSEKVYPLVLEYDGSITGEHNDGLVRSPYLKQQFGEEMYGLFEEVKRIFDPENIFNPGKKVGSSWEYALRHLATNEGAKRKVTPGS